MVQNFSPFQGRKFSRFTAWTSEVDDIIAYVNGEIQVILGVFSLDFTIWTYCRRKRNRWFEMIICADRSETVARSIGLEFGGGLNGTVFRAPPSCPLYTRGACAQKPLSGTVRPNTQARYKSEFMNPRCRAAHRLILILYNMIQFISCLSIYNIIMIM